MLPGLGGLLHRKGPALKPFGPGSAKATVGQRTKSPRTGQLRARPRSRRPTRGRRITKQPMRTAEHLAHVLHRRTHRHPPNIRDPTWVS